MNSQTLQRRQTHFACLDLCDFHWTAKSAQKSGSDSAILLEVWHSGGLFQIGSALPGDSMVTISSPDGKWEVQGTVESCKQDDYGFLAEVRVDSPDAWFPHRYRPPYLMRRRHAAIVVPKILRAS
jgi:hypothetical protein